MLLGVAICTLVAMSLAAAVLDSQTLKPQEAQQMAHATGKMRTICVGRFLVDMPESAEINLTQPRIGGFEISTFNETEAEFQKRVIERESQIRKTPDWRGGDANLESTREVKTSSGLVGKIFIHSRTVVEGTQGNGLGKVERYRHEGISTEALVHGHGISIDLFYENRALELVDDLPTLVNQLVANPDNRIPSEPGFCIDRAYVRDPLSADQGEQIMMFARLPKHPDVKFTFISAAGLKPDTRGVLARNDAVNASLPWAERMRVSRLRGAGREIDGIQDEELVELVVEDNDAHVHSFWWEVNGTEDNLFVPHVVLQMNTGNGNRVPVPSSLSNRVALGLWDKILSNLRLRTKPAALNKATASTTLLAMPASTDERCLTSKKRSCNDVATSTISAPPT